MHELDDHALLRQYAEQNSEAAFAALVTRHLDKVYSVALRHTRNVHAAEEITQAVFVILAKKSGRLGAKVILSGWLYETARLTAVTFIRSEIRRARREQEAHMQTALNENESEVWPHIAPLLDDAMAKLSEADRHAIVLRYFDGQSLGEVGAALGASEDAAKKRVTRAVEKLRSFFTKRGVTLKATALTAAISANSVQATPLGLAATVTATAAKGTLVSATLTTLVKGTMKTMTWLKIKFAVGVSVAALLAGGAATVAISGSNTNADNKAVSAEDTVLIVPGMSVGKVRKGMTTNEVEAVLGKPDKWQGKIMVYDKNLGMSVGQTKLGVMVVMCGDSLLKYPGVKKFKGRTKEGIGMESSREDVIKAFGQPTTAKPWNAGQEQLEYKGLGLTFTLETGKVMNIEVDFRPKN